MNEELALKLQSIQGVEQVIQKKPVTFIHGDNMALLRYMKEEMMKGYFHVGIVDPPYGISVGNMNLGATKDSKPRNYEMGEWDASVPELEYWHLLNYVCRNLIIWGGNYFTDSFTDGYKVEFKDGSYKHVKDLTVLDRTKIQSVEFVKGVMAGRCFIVWDKQNDKMSFAAGELALTTFDKNAVIIRRPRNASSADEEKERRHPTQKPVYLYDYLHLNFVDRGQRVLDTHGGSFSHAVAAHKNNVNLTIIDREKSYFQSGLTAYENSSSKGRLLF
jgi:site-specific DNA-methyltransferase (adenine-specific)